MSRCIQDGAARCQTVPGAVVDDAVGALLLDTLTPHALEVALSVQTELDTRAGEADALRRQARRTRPPPRRPGSAPLPGRRPGQPARRRQPRSRLERRAACPASRPRRLRTRHPGRRSRTHRRASKTKSIHWQQISPPCGPTRTPPQRDRKRMVRLLVDDVTLHKTDRIHLHVRLRGGQTRSLAVAIPPTSWQARQTRSDTVKALDRLLDTHTDAEVAETLNAEGHRSGESKPFTAGIVVHVRRKYHLPSHAERLRAQGLLTTTELAQHLGVHPSTVKSWTKAGILNSHKANDKNERLYEPPTAGDPRLTTRQGSPLRKRVPIQPTTGGAL